MRVMTWPLIAAVMTASLVTTLSASDSFAEQLVRAEAQAAAPDAAAQLRDASPAVNAVFLDYADSPELRLSARLSLLRYPEMAAEVLPLYGDRKAFKAILRRFGPAVLPPIHYFLNNDIDSLEIRRAAGMAVSRSRTLIERWWHGAENAVPGGDGNQPLDAIARGWYAIRFIRDDGHSFLGQFEVAPSGQVIWIQTDRVVTGLSGFFTSGLQALETSLRTKGRAPTEDYLWAGVDLAAFIGVTKLLRAGRTATKAARGGAIGSRLSRAAITSRTLGRGVGKALRVGKWGVPVAIGYAVLRHPALITSLSAQAGRWLGVPVWFMQGLVWTTILLPVFWLLSVLWRWLVRPTGTVLIVTGRWLRRWRRVRRGRNGYASRGSAGFEPAAMQR